MSFKKLLQCCFPRNRDQIISNEEETVDIKYVTDEKVIDMSKSNNLTPGSKDSPTHVKGGTKTQGSVYEEDKTTSGKIKLDSKFKSMQPGNNNLLMNNNNSNSESNNSNNLGVAPHSHPNQNNINNQSQVYNLLDKKAFSSFTSFAKVESHLSESTVNNDPKPAPGNFKRDNTRQNTNKKNDDSSVDIVYSTRHFTDDDCKKAPTILLEELSGDVLKNNKLVINAGGLINGLRKLRDGVAFFGKNSKSETFLNDFELNMNLDHQASNCVFIIYYKKDTNKYYLRSYKDKQNQSQGVTMLLIKVDVEEFPILKKEIISISDYFFQISPIENSNGGGIEIMKLISNSKANFEKEKYNFDQSDKIFTLGRDNNCNISFPGDKAFSKIQATFTYSQEKKCWMLRDGTKDKTSTNGTWLYAAHSYEIKDNTMFRVGNSKIVITYQ